MYLYYLSGFIFLMNSFMMFYLSMYFIMMKYKMFYEWYWLNLNSLKFNMYIYIDWMSLMFMFTVFIISSMIMFYSIEYMNHDNQNMRFFWMLLMFIISMMLMILSPNILTILIGWDGLGLTSFCLIIYYQNKSSFNSGMLTVLINRIGDIFIILTISLMMNFGSFNFLNFNKLNNLILIFIIIASFTKSAQFPFSSWLPAAMAAPTPVSSLVHSSTLVTAGIYMLIRFNNLLNNNMIFLKYMLITGLITMLMAGLSANFEFDLKKIIAYSTLSQLGLMIMILSFKMINLTFFHLIIHAMFKSMMFMCSGIIIHLMNNYQDIRNLSNMKKFMPLTSMMFMISNFSLCGLPFFSGFFSKDLLLESMIFMKLNFNIFMLLILSTMLTVMYSFRLIYYLFKNNMKFLTLYNIKEIKLMNLSMMILMIFSIKFGMMLNWMLFNNIENTFFLKFEKMLILMICMFGMIMNYLMFKTFAMINKYYLIKMFLGKMWFIYNMNYIFSLKILNFSMNFYKNFDKGWSEEFFKLFILNLSNKFNLFEKYKFNYYMNLIFMLMVIILSMMILFN